MTMKRLFLLSIFAALGICLMATFSVSFAAEIPKTIQKPTCGKTVEECQKALEIDEQKVQELTLAYQGATQQRDIAAKSLADTQLQAYVLQQVQAKK